jgi:hypothetical protein
MSTRHKRLHANTLMAWRPAHELHEVPQVMDQNIEHFPTLPIKCLTFGLPSESKGEANEGEETQRLIHGEQLYQPIPNHCFCGFIVANPIVLIC